MQVVASNGVASSVSVVHQDAGLLQRGREVRALGANIAVADTFDAGWHHLPQTCTLCSLLCCTVLHKFKATFTTELSECSVQSSHLVRTLAVL